jgi:hypothetical protein
MVLLIRQNLGFGFFHFIQLVTCGLRVTWPSWIPWIRDSLFGPSGSASTPLSFLTYNQTMRLFNITKKISKQRLNFRMPWWFLEERSWVSQNNRQNTALPGFTNL